MLEAQIKSSKKPMEHLEMDNGKYFSCQSVCKRWENTAWPATDTASWRGERENDQLQAVEASLSQNENLDILPWLCSYACYQPDSAAQSLLLLPTAQLSERNRNAAVLPTETRLQRSIVSWTQGMNQTAQSLCLKKAAKPNSSPQLVSQNTSLKTMMPSLSTSHTLNT